jgi:hypothetical protein
VAEKLGDGSDVIPVLDQMIERSEQHHASKIPH